MKAVLPLILFRVAWKTDALTIVWSWIWYEVIRLQIIIFIVKWVLEQPSIACYVLKLINSTGIPLLHWRCFSRRASDFFCFFFYRISVLHKYIRCQGQWDLLDTILGDADLQVCNRLITHYHWGISSSSERVNNYRHFCWRVQYFRETVRSHMNFSGRIRASYLVDCLIVSWSYKYLELLVEMEDTSPRILLR